MTGYQNGPYFYYLPELPKPQVAEIDGGVVWFAGDDQCVRLDKCTGRFVRLVEATADAIAELILENSLAADAKEPDEPAHGFFPGKPYPPVGAPIATEETSE